MKEKYITKEAKVELFEAEKLERLLYRLSFHLSPLIDIPLVVRKIEAGLPQYASVEELFELASESIASLATNHHDHSVLASRVCVSLLQKALPESFTENLSYLSRAKHSKFKKAASLICPKIEQLARDNKDKLDKAIKPDRDYEMSYFGFKTLEKSYFLRVGGICKETPQFMFMRVALGIHQDDVDRAIETYNLMSQKYFIHASPTLFNSGTNNPFLSSCFLLGIESDSIDGIYKTLHKTAMISKSAGGLGIHVHNVRAKGSYIAGSNGTSNGLIPMLRVFNNTARYVDQGGNKRPGAFAIYLEPWHGDVFDFLDLRKNHGKEELRARDLFQALWIPDLFMQKVELDEDWCLFSEDECPGLSDVYGKEFEELYNSYEAQGRYIRKVKAQQLWSAILEAQTEAGTPFMLYKDACNAKSNQQNLGTIKSSNLCCEIVEYSSNKETAVCNLASVALPSFFDGSRFDFEKLHSVVKVVVANLDKVIEVGKYPTKEAERSNKKHRPIAVGVQGLADLFMMMRFPFDSQDAQVLNTQIFETIYHASVESSIELATEYGPYASFKGSPISQGQFQFDLWNRKPQPHDLFGDWDALRLKIKQHGIRNSLLVAPMPTASTSQILGFTECFEPLTSNIYTRRVLSGEFQVVNKYLLDDLQELGLWNEDMKYRIIQEEGSIQSISEIPQEIRNLHKTVWELSQKVTIDLAADRAPFVDQSQSMNLFLKSPTRAKMTSMHFYAWKKGLKTGMYYFRTQAASSAIKFTVPQPVVMKRQLSEEFLDRKRQYTPLLGTPSLDGDSPSCTPSLDSDPFRILDTTPVSCNLSEPGNCDSCSG